MKPLVQIKNLSVNLGGVQILEDISFDINKNEVLAIVGPNGAGKTVLFRAILGINTSYKGSVAWQKNARIGYVPQKITFEKNFPLTVKELFLLEMRKKNSFWRVSKKTTKNIVEKLTSVQAEHLLNARLGNLSQGEFQRVLIALSLTENPDVIFFDEPVSGIDAAGEETIYQLIYKLHKEKGITLVIVSHELNIVYRFASRVICLNKTMVCNGSPEDALDKDTMKKLYGEHSGHYSHKH